MSTHATNRNEIILTYMVIAAASFLTTPAISAKLRTYLKIVGN